MVGEGLPDLTVGGFFLIPLPPLLIERGGGDTGDAESVEGDAPGVEHTKGEMQVPAPQPKNAARAAEQQKRDEQRFDASRKANGIQHDEPRKGAHDDSNFEDGIAAQFVQPAGICLVTGSQAWEMDLHGMNLFRGVICGNQVAKGYGVILPRVRAAQMTKSNMTR